MEHNVSLITTIAAAFGLALLFGFTAERLKVPALVGYLLAGIMIGPATPGFVADVGIASQLSEIGVMLLMFGVGLHFFLDDLLAVKRIAEALRERGIPYVVAEQNREQVEDLRKQGVAAVSGNAADPAALIQAHIADAAMLVIATPDPVGVRQMAETARPLNPDIEIVLRTHGEDESLLLRNEGIGTVFFGEEELAKGMMNHVLQRFAPPSATSAQGNAGRSGGA